MSQIKLFLAIGLISSLVACGGSSGGGSKQPTLPADAVSITSNNAAAVAESAISTVESISIIPTIIGVEANIPLVRIAINTLITNVFNEKNPATSVAAGVTDSYPCPSDGSISDTYTFSGDTSYSGTATFSNCNSDGFILNGSFGYSSTWNNDTGAYSDSGSGSLTTTIGSDSFTMTVDYAETGNLSSGDYSVQLTYSITGSVIGGYLVETTQALQGTYPGDVTSGQIIVTGANNTRLRITVTSSSTADIELDSGNGTFVFFGDAFI